MMKYKKTALRALLAAALLCAVTLSACTANPKSEPAFDLELAKSWASSFSTVETDRAKIGEIGYTHYMDTFMGEDVPEQYRILSHKVTEAQHHTDSAEEFSVRITSDYTCCSTYWLSANGEFVPQEDGSYSCAGNQQFLYIRALGGDRYEIYDIGTGGNFPGEPVEDDDVSDSGATVSDGGISVSDGVFTYDLTDIDQAIDWAILQRSGGAYLPGEFPVAAHRIFDTVVDGEVTTVYIQFVYAEMSLENSVFTEASGGAGPARLTLRKNASGGYDCEEYTRALKDAREIFSDKAYDAYRQQADIEDLYATMRERCKTYLLRSGKNGVTVHLGGETLIVSLDFLWPLPEGIGSYDGSLDAYPGHTGVDILATRGTEVFASAGGEVMEAEGSPIGPYGRQIYILHDSGYYTRYAHLDSVAVKVGDKVEQGQLIGRVGDSGNATTCHLHFEVCSASQEILDPLDFIQ